MSYTHFITLLYEVYSKAIFSNVSIPLINGTPNLTENSLLSPLKQQLEIIQWTSCENGHFGAGLMPFSKGLLQLKAQLGRTLSYKRQC